MRCHLAVLDDGRELVPVCWDVAGLGRGRERVEKEAGYDEAYGKC